MDRLAEEAFAAKTAPAGRVNGKSSCAVSPGGTTAPRITKYCGNVVELIAAPLGTTATE